MLNEYLKSINKNKEDIMEDDFAEKSYPSYIVNRCLSNFADTLFHANEMNVNNHLDNRLQYDYLRFSIRPQNRFSPWQKQEKDDKIQKVMQYFGYSRIKSEEILSILTDEDFNKIEESLYCGEFFKEKKRSKK